MFTVIVETSFSATHRLRLADGTTEPHHGHDWIVRAHFSSATLSDVAMVVDFEDARRALQSIVGPMHHADLNSFAPFEGRNPTAEIVARFIHDQLAAVRLGSIRKVEVTEAPGCTAAFEPGSSPKGA